MMVRDSGSNVIKACREWGIPNFSCVGHNLHLITGPLLMKPKGKSVLPIATKMMSMISTMIASQNVQKGSRKVVIPSQTHTARYSKRSSGAIKDVRLRNAISNQRIKTSY